MSKPAATIAPAMIQVLAPVRDSATGRRYGKASPAATTLRESVRRARRPAERLTVPRSYDELHSGRYRDENDEEYQQHACAGSHAPRLAKARTVFRGGLLGEG